MEQDSLPTEIILSHSRQSLGKVKLDWMPQPGNYLELEGKTYAVLERHHHYQYKIGGYYLDKISLYVQKAHKPTERTLVEGHWVLGDASCRFNARSEIFRCAINPSGPCQGCRHYEQLKKREF
jgi:hypothetical protein